MLGGFTGKGSLTDIHLSHTIPPVNMVQPSVMAFRSSRMTTVSIDLVTLVELGVPEVVCSNLVGMLPRRSLQVPYDP